MARNASTGDATEYDTSAEDALTAAMDSGYEPPAVPEPAPPRQAPSVPTSMRVTARVEWSGADTGMRTTRLDGLNLQGVHDVLGRVRAAEQQERQVQPAASYRATGWHAQLRALTGHSRGSEAADQAGLAPSDQTLRRWLAEDQTPSRANRGRIADAYEALRMRMGAVEQARGNARAARHELATEITDALRDRYGAEIRFTDIRDLRFE